METSVNTFETAAWKVSSDTGKGVLFEYFKLSVMTGSELDRRLASATMFTVESVRLMLFDDGNPLLSGNADSKAHSSSSAGADGCADFCFTVTELDAKSNKEAEGDVCEGVDCLAGAVREAKGLGVGWCGC
jgi:hypothetical protein